MKLTHPIRFLNHKMSKDASIDQNFNSNLGNMNGKISLEDVSQKRKAFAIFGNLLVKRSQKRKWWHKQDSLAMEDSFMYGVQRYKRYKPIMNDRRLTIEENNKENASTSSSQKERMKRIEQIIQENMSSDSYDDEDLHHETHEEIENTPEPIASKPQKSYLKDYIKNLPKKPLFELNCCYTLIENFYGLDTNFKVTESNKPKNKLISKIDVDEYHEFLEDYAHYSCNDQFLEQNEKGVVGMLPSPNEDPTSEDQFEEIKTKFNTIDHDSFHLRTLE